MSRNATYRTSRAAPLVLSIVALILLVAGLLLATGGGQAENSPHARQSVSETGRSSFTRQPTQTLPTNPKPVPSSDEAPEKGDEAPDFELPTLAGEKVKLSDYEGNVVMLDFWSVTCGPCVQATAHLQKLYTEYKDDGFVVIGINLDTYPEMIKKFVERARLTYPIVKADNAVIENYGGLATIPQSFLVDKKGKIYKHYKGFGMAYVYQMKKDVRKLLEIE